MKVEFRTCLSEDTNNYISVPGVPYLDMYEYGLDDKGRRQLKKTKEVDKVYEKIQSFEESTDINLIMERFAAGDESVLNVNKGFYIDTSDLPTNLFEVYERGIEAENYFNGLPTDLKEMFDNSPTSFFLSDEKEFSSKVSKYNEKFENKKFDNISQSSDNVSNNNIDEVVYNG